VQSVDDFLAPQVVRTPSRHGDNQFNSTLATSSDTSSVCSSRSAVPASSDGGDDDNMSTLRPSGSRRDYDGGFDFYGLEESTVDSDEEDISSVNTEVM